MKPALAKNRIRSQISRAQRGMGIVELMVGLVIGLFMATALAWFYLGSRTLSRTSDDVSRMQESGRNALESMGMAIRQAGYRANVSAALSGAPLSGINANIGADSITIKYDAQEKDGETDCGGNAILAGVTMTETFTVDTTTNPPSLKCNGVAIVDNIEDMQIQYGIDANRDGTIELYKTQPAANEFQSVAAVRVAFLVRGPSPRAAALKLDATTQTYMQSVYFNGASVNYTDGYLRQAYTGTFAVRPQAY